MTTQDQYKPLHVGFTILRRDCFRKRIKTLTVFQGNFHWKIYKEGFKTNRELEAHLKDLLKDQRTIED